MGLLDEAATHFEDALAFCRCGFGPELAWAHYDCARALLRRDSPGDVGRARELLREGGRISRELDMRPLHGKIEDVLKRVDRTAVSPQRPAGLSGREVEVLRLVTKGFTNQDIAEQLFISPNTVARHVHKILGKIGAANRAEATGLAIRERWID